MIPKNHGTAVNGATYICMCVLFMYVGVHIYICMYVCMYTCMYVFHTYKCMCVRIYVCLDPGFTPDLDTPISKESEMFGGKFHSKSSRLRVASVQTPPLREPAKW